MLKRAWDGRYAPSLIVLIGIAILAAMASSAFYLKGGHRADERHHAEYKAREAARDAYRECRRMPTVQEALECQHSADKASREKQIAEHDLDAQWEMADWAEYIFWATIFIGCGTLIATALGVYWVKKTLTETTAAVTAANRTNQIMLDEQRPWIKILSIEGDLFLNGDELAFEYKMKVQNVGKSPAYMVIDECSLIEPYFVSNVGNFERLKSLMQKKAMFFFTETIFPRDKLQMRQKQVRCSLWRKDFSYDERSVGPDGTPILTTVRPAYEFVAACRYRGFVDGERYATGTTYNFDVASKNFPLPGERLRVSLIAQSGFEII